jgi:hypothetical protein
LESVANAHTAADLHVRPVSKTALVSRSWAPRTKLKLHDARRPAMHLMQHLCALKLTSRRAGSHVVCRLESKFLNQRADSCVSGALSQFAKRTKKIHKFFKARGAKPNFPNALHRYGDKWLAKRSFSRLPEQGNSRLGCTGNNQPIFYLTA